MIADVGHVGATAYVFGIDSFLDYRSYNATTTGNITFTCFLFVVRALYLLGLLGRDRDPSAARAKKDA